MSKRTARLLQSCQHQALVATRHQMDDGHVHEETDTLRPLREGQAIGPGSEIVEVIPGADPCEYELRTVHGGAGHRGPARVATATYRDNYDTIFGKRPTAQA
jgi:hypothetical protein